MDNDFLYRFISFCVDKKSIADDFLKKLSRSGYEIQYADNPTFSHKYKKNKHNIIVINVRKLETFTDSELQHKHFWFVQEKDFYDIQRTEGVCCKNDFLEITIRNNKRNIPNELLQKVNKIFQKEFGFVLGDKKTIIDYI